MQNAHLRLGRLEYIKPAVSPKSTPTHVTVTMDRVIVEPASDEKQAPRCHLLSVFGGEQEIAAIHAAIGDQANFRIAGPDLSLMVISLGERAHVPRLDSSAGAPAISPASRVCVSGFVRNASRRKRAGGPHDCLQRRAGISGLPSWCSLWHSSAPLLEQLHSSGTYTAEPCSSIAWYRL